MANEFEDSRAQIKIWINKLEDFLKKDLKERINFCWHLNITRHMGDIQRNYGNLQTAIKEENTKLLNINRAVIKKLEELTELFVKNSRELYRESEELIELFIKRVKNLLKLS